MTKVIQAPDTDEYLKFLQRDKERLEEEQALKAEEMEKVVTKVLKGVMSANETLEEKQA